MFLKQKTGFLTGIICLIISLYTVVANAEFPSFPSVLNIPPLPEMQAKSYLLIDFWSDAVLAEKESGVRVEPASLTKMMTVYVADQALKHHKISEQDRVKISENAWRASGSRMFLDLNSEVPVNELLHGIIIQSGNDASIAIAEHIAGSEANFAALMNHFAQELGMTSSHFTNATGLPDPNHYTTARDMAILAKAIIRDFPESYALYSEKEYTYKNIKQTNRNRLLWKHDWVDGIKTGHTNTAGYCLVASGKQGDMRLIAVLMGALDDKTRTEESNQLLSHGFQYYETRKLFPKETMIKQAKVWMGQKNEIDLGFSEDVYLTLAKGQFDHLQTQIEIDPVIKAPLAKGAPFGMLSIQAQDKTLAEHPLVALQALETAGFFKRWYDRLLLALHSLW